MALDPNILKQLAKAFEMDLQTQLAVITDNVLKLEAMDDAESSAALDALFRAAHNIKGAAQSLGFNSISEVSHSLESVFTAMRKGHPVLRAQVVDVALSSADWIRDVAHKLGIGENIDPANVALQKESLVALLEVKTAPVLVESPIQSSTPSRHSGSISISEKQLDVLVNVSDELLETRIALSDHLDAISDLAGSLDELQNRFSIPLVMDSFGVSDVMRAVGAAAMRLQEVHWAIEHTQAHLYKYTEDLQQQLAELRLVPFTSLVQHLRRVAREVGRELDKNIQLHVEGEQIQADRIILETIRAPLMHALRNAIDHGIEGAQERINKGKVKDGQLKIEISSQGGLVRVRLSDDGRGIDVSSVVKKALQSGMISLTDLNNMTEDEKLRLVFRSGLTTKERVTPISGRGVGMDVVLQQVNAVKGELLLESVPGQGTRLTFILPVTLAVEHGIIVKLSNKLFAFPSRSIERVMTVSANELRSEGNQKILDYNDRKIPVHLLSVVLELPNASKLAGNVDVVILSDGIFMMAFVVDEIMWERELMVKPLNFPLQNFKLFTGGSLTGLGEIILVLDEVALLARLSRTGDLITSEIEVERTPSCYRILVVDDSITSRTLVKNIIENEGYCVVSASNGEEAWDKLSASSFDLVVSDIEMPKMNGYELTEKIRADELTKSIPVIIVSSLSDELQKQKGKDSGADSFIVKSEFDTQQLLSTIKELL